MKAREIGRLLWDAARRWYEDSTFQLGAALAFYTVFSLAPVVLIAVSIGGLVFGEEAARRQVSQELASLAGPNVAQAFVQVTQTIYASGSGVLATVLGFALLLVGATTVFAQLQHALNTVWGVKPKGGRGVVGLLKDRIWTFAMVLAIGFLLLVSLVISAVLSAAAAWLEPSTFSGGSYLWQALNWAVSFGLVTLLFALIYKVLPDVEIAWGDVWVGAAFTALLFSIGKYLIGLYLGQSSVVSAYGAAGSLVLVLLWVYYSSQILLFGAEFTYVYARHSGKPLVARKNAEAATDEARARQGEAPASREEVGAGGGRSGHAQQGAHAAQRSGLPASRA